MIKTIQPEDRWVQVKDLELHYLDWGATHPQSVLLLHGFLSHAHIWDGFASRICSDYHVLALDQRGHGASSWAIDGAYSLDDHFLDLTGFVECLDLKDLVIIGHSMGGRNALFYAACCPERIKALVLVDARPANSDESVLALKNLLDGIGFVEDIDESFGSTYDPNLVVGVELAGYKVEELWPVMRGVACPTLVIRGENSRFLSREDAERMYQYLPIAELVEIPRTSHLPLLERPAAFQEAVFSFLNRLSMLS